jgi:hypothetical protein
MAGSLKRGLRKRHRVCIACEWTALFAVDTTEADGSLQRDLFAQVKRKHSGRRCERQGGRHDRVRQCAKMRGGSQNAEINRRWSGEIGAGGVRGDVSASRGREAVNGALDETSETRQSARVWGACDRDR